MLMRNYHHNMRFLIASDIHGSQKAANRVKELFEMEKADKLLLLGDILYHGPRNDLPQSYAPKSVIEIMNSLSDKIIAVRGNCEAEVDQMVLAFPCLSTTAIVFDGKAEMVMSHGHIYNEENLPPGNGCFLYGHTHIPVAKKLNGRVIFNPGSTTIPKNGFPASYGIYEDGVFTVKRLKDQEEMMSIDI